MCWASQVSDLAAHSGPPFPIVTDRQSGHYVISIWTDPDATDDGAAGGRFWIVVGTADGKAPAGTQVSISAKPDTGGSAAQPTRITEAGSDGRTYYGALVLDHEGPYRVDVGIDGPLGSTTVPSHVDATYDLRPSPLTAVLYVVPFALIGLLWARMLLKRSRASNGPSHVGRGFSAPPGAGAEGPGLR
jgi:hypothetical protein